MILLIAVKMVGFWEEPSEAFPKVVLLPWSHWCEGKILHVGCHRVHNSTDIRMEPENQSQYHSPHGKNTYQVHFWLLSVVKMVNLLLPGSCLYRKIMTLPKIDDLQASYLL